MLVVRAVGLGLDHAQIQHVAFDCELIIPQIKCISPSVATVVLSFDVLPDTTFPFNLLGICSGLSGHLTAHRSGRRSQSRGR